MKRHIGTFMIGLLLAALPFAGWAQEETKKKPEGVNALKYSMQKRHVKKGVPFENRRLLDNLYFSYMMGIQKVAPNGANEFDGGINMGLAVGKQYSPNSDVRLSFNFAQNERFIGQPLKRIGLDVDHLFNVTSYIMGFEPNRRLELVTVEGLGLQWVNVNKESKMAFDAHVGLQTKVHLNPQIDIFLEPKVGVATRSLNFATEKDRAYNLYYGVSAGFRYIMRDGGFIKTKEDLKLGTSAFWSVGTGAQMHLSGLEGSGLGPTLNIALGRWVMPGVGFRISGTLSTNTWHLANYEANEQEEKPAYRCYETSSYMGARGEVMFDPIMFFKKYDEQEKLKMKLFFGGEFGKMSKANRDLPIRRYYSGLTGGIQVGYRVQDDMLLYLEPHYTSANYKIPYTNVDASKGFTDNLLSLNVGLEFCSPMLSRKKTNETFKEFFERKLFVGVEGGFNWPIHPKRFQEKSYLDYQAGAFVGYQLTPVHGVSLHGDINRVSMDRDDGYRQFNLVSAALDYRFNVLNAIQGYTPDRLLDVNALVGPVVTMRKNAKNNSVTNIFDPFEDYESVTYSTLEDNKICVGGEFALETTYHVNEKLGIYVKPQLRIYPSSIFPSEYISGWRKIVSCQVGATYFF